MAALKKKLFGAQEQGVTKYRKEGSLSPKYTHPTNASFESGYTFSKESSPFYRENSPNINNNNGLDVDPATPPPPQLSNQNGASAAVDVPLPKNSSSGLTEEGLYDPPWETSAVSKFKVIGRMRAGSAAGSSGKPAGKERTPPPVSPKTKKQAAGIMFGEVSMTEVPTPGSMELRNVHSLERSKHKKERQERQKQRKQEQAQQKEEQLQHSPPVHSYSLDRAGRRETSPGHGAAASTSPDRQHSLSLDRRGAPSPGAFMPPPTSSVGAGGEDDSLLASITDTLQRQSKYGSDALLSPPTSRMSDMEPQKTKKVPNEVRMSSRGELEKIRAAHRRDPPAPPMGVAISPGAPPTHSSPMQRTTPTPTRSSPQGIGNGMGNNRISPQGTSAAVPITRTSPRPQAYLIPMMSSRKSPPNQKGSPPTNSAHQQQWISPSHAASAISSKHVAPHHSSQILTSSNSINGSSRSSGQAAGNKRRIFSGRPRMAASLDELQTDPSTQVTYDASSKSHIFRSLV